MNYEELTAKELRALCEQHGIKPSRAKADMVEDLKAFDAANLLIEHDHTEGLYAPAPAVEEAQAPEVPAGQETPAESHSEPQTEAVWIEDGRLYKQYPRRDQTLGVEEHQENLGDVVTEAVSRGLEHYGPAFRDRSLDSATWIYAINVR